MAKHVSGTALSGEALGTAALHAAPLRIPEHTPQTEAPTVSGKFTLRLRERS
jgi:hypothetical protein